eukprot:gene23716-biopygen23851
MSLVRANARDKARRAEGVARSTEGARVLHSGVAIPPFGFSVWEGQRPLVEVVSPARACGWRKLAVTPLIIHGRCSQPRAGPIGEAPGALRLEPGRNGSGRSPPGASHTIYRYAIYIESPHHALGKTADRTRGARQISKERTRTGRGPDAGVAVSPCTGCVVVVRDREEWILSGGRQMIPATLTPPLWGIKCKGRRDGSQSLLARHCSGSADPTERGGSWWARRSCRWG